MAWLALSSDLATLGFHQVFGDCQPQAAAGVALAAGPEAVEDMSEVSGWDAGAIVVDDDAQGGEILGLLNANEHMAILGRVAQGIGKEVA